MISLMRSDVTCRAWMELTRDIFSRSSLEIRVRCTSDLYFSRSSSSTVTPSIRAKASSKQAHDLLLLLFRGCRQAASGSGHLANRSGDWGVVKSQRRACVLCPDDGAIVGNLPSGRLGERLGNMVFIHPQQGGLIAVEDDLQLGNYPGEELRDKSNLVVRLGGGGRSIVVEVEGVF